MESHHRPIRELAEALRAFVGPARGQLFCVTADASLWDAAVEVAMSFEHHADNTSPFFRLDAPYAADGSCWDARARAVRELHEARREAMAKHGYALGALGPPPRAATPLARFGATLSQVLGAACAPLTGAVMVAAPGQVADAAAFERDLGELARAMPQVRWILVERDPACSVGPALAAATRAGHARVVVDETEACRELEQKLDAASLASADAPAFAQRGGAWPKGALPPGSAGRAERRSAAAAAVAASLGLPAALFGHALRDLRNQILRGGLALRRGDPLAAVRYQSQAAKAAIAAGLGRESVLMEMLVATYLVAAEQRPLARERYQACAERASQKGWHDLAAQSLMAMGSLHLLDRDRAAASVAYGWAGRAARDGHHDSLAIEGFRMAGQCALEDGNADMAARLFTEALAIASPLGDAVAGRTSAPVAARQLADHFDRLGARPQAASLREQASRMDAAARGGEAA